MPFLRTLVVSIFHIFLKGEIGLEDEIQNELSHKSSKFIPQGLKKLNLFFFSEFGVKILTL
uniref:Uncharacterized protein n=1 Tax=Rhizophora mucronata TaxID=61149 RepID=A0A2P2JAB4_RHIMU